MPTARPKRKAAFVSRMDKRMPWDALLALIGTVLLPKRQTAGHHAQYPQCCACTAWPTGSIWPMRRVKTRCMATVHRPGKKRLSKPQPPKQATSLTNALTRNKPLSERDKQINTTKS